MYDYQIEYKLGPFYMVSGTWDNPTPNLTWAS